MKILMNDQCHPVLRDILNNFAADVGATVEPMNDEVKVFISSDYCQECDGDGMSPDDNEQCEECERLHRLEVRADMRMDEIKEGI